MKPIPINVKKNPAAAVPRVAPVQNKKHTVGVYSYSYTKSKPNFDGPSIENKQEAPRY